MPKRIQLKRTKGWRKPENTAVVTRSTIYGNPFRVSEYLSASAAVAAYKTWIISQDPQAEMVFRAAKANLRGKNLGCFCKLGDPCHADVLLEIANA